MKIIKKYLFVFLFKMKKPFFKIVIKQSVASELQTS